MVSKKTLNLNPVTLLLQKKTLESKRIIITRIEKKETSPIYFKDRWGLFSFGFLYNVLERFLPMVKSPPRALFGFIKKTKFGRCSNK